MTRPRIRRTNAQLAEIDEAIIEVVRENAPITLRGVFYRVLSMQLVDKESGYGVISRQLLKLRRSGDVDYGDITDGTRWVVRPNAFRNLNSMLRKGSFGYTLDLWQDLDCVVWLFTEKDAMVGTVTPVTEEWCIPVGVVRGYSSDTLIYNTALDIVDENHEDDDDALKPVYIYQLGDHDPSGMDAWRSFQQKIQEFAPGANVHFERLAITCDQIQTYALPDGVVNPKDPRTKGWYRQRNGSYVCPNCGVGTVQVDALPPTVMRDMVLKAVHRHATDENLAETQRLAAEEAEFLRDVAAARKVHLTAPRYSRAYKNLAGRAVTTRGYEKSGWTSAPTNLIRL